MLFDKQKPPISTSVLTGILLIGLGAGGSFKAAAPAIISIINGILWLILGYQRFKQE